MKDNCVGCEGKRICVDEAHGNSKEKPKTKNNCVGCEGKGICVDETHGNSKEKPRSRTANF